MITDAYQRSVDDGRLTADPAQAEAIARLDALARALDAPPPSRGLLGGLLGGTRRPPPPRGLYVWGPVGRGKSMLMDLFHDEVAMAAKRRVHFHEFMQSVHAGLNRARKDGAQDAIAPVAEQLARDVRLLCLDEMQISDIADAMIVGRLFERLFSAGVVVVTTSNRPPSDLYKNGLNRHLFVPFIKLIEERLDIVELAGPQDYRQGFLAAADSWLVPADRTARARLDAAWEALAGGNGAPLDIPLKGRSVHLPLFRNGVGRAAFWELCARPLGPPDYLALAARLRVLILDEIPRLGRDNFNEARRFVLLVDALYEAGTGLIASAADQPEALYLEGEGVFEFARTASRLRQMQSAQWLEAASGSRN